MLLLFLILMHFFNFLLHLRFKPKRKIMQHILKNIISRSDQADKKGLRLQSIVKCIILSKFPSFLILLLVLKKKHKKQPTMSLQAGRRKSLVSVSLPLLFLHTCAGPLSLDVDGSWHVCICSLTSSVIIISACAQEHAQVGTDHGNCS